MGSTTSKIAPQKLIRISKKAMETHTLLGISENEDHYLSQIKESLTNSLSRYHVLYGPMAPDFLPKDLLIIQNWIDMFEQNNAHWNYFRELKNLNQPIWILPLSYSADAGMPHTRGKNCICVPGGFFDNNVEHFDNNERNAITLRHELLHIHQKAYPEYWNEMYKKAWNCEKWSGKLPEKYEAIRRINPDTEWSGLYTIKNCLVPFCVFADINRPSLQRTFVWYYNINKRTVWKSKGIFDLPPELVGDKIWTDPRINMAMREHPNEMSAWLLSNPERYTTCEIFKALNRN